VWFSEERLLPFSTVTASVGIGVEVVGETLARIAVMHQTKFHRIGFVYIFDLGCRLHRWVVDDVAFS